MLWRDKSKAKINKQQFGSFGSRAHTHRTPKSDEMRNDGKNKNRKFLYLSFVVPKQWTTEQTIVLSWRSCCYCLRNIIHKLSLHRRRKHKKSLRKSAISRHWIDDLHKTQYKQAEEGFGLRSDDRLPNASKKERTKNQKYWYKTMVAVCIHVYSAWKHQRSDSPIHLSTNEFDRKSFRKALIVFPLLINLAKQP